MIPNAQRKLDHVLQCFYQEDITLDKQFKFKFGIQEDTETKRIGKMLHLQHCSLRIGKENRYPAPYAFEIRCRSKTETKQTRYANEDVLSRVDEEGLILITTRRSKANWIGHAIRINRIRRENWRDPQ